MQQKLIAIIKKHNGLCIGVPVIYFIQSSYLQIKLYNYGKNNFTKRKSQF